MKCIKNIKNTLQNKILYQSILSLDTWHSKNGIGHTLFCDCSPLLLFIRFTLS